MDENKSIPIPVIVYIAGYGRSGSTLLDVLLGNHPMIFGAGEVDAFLTDWANGLQCACGQRYSECPFWRKVVEQLYTVFPDLDPLVVEHVIKKVEASLNLSPSPLGSHTLDYKFYSQFWRTMMMSISRESGRNIIIDSSKSSRSTARRLGALINVCGFKVKVVHLIRDPRAVVFSNLRGSNKLLEAGQRQPKLRGAAIRAMIGWGMANISVHLTVAANRQLDVMQLKYEDLVFNPVQELHRLGAFLNLDLEPVVDAVVNERPLDPGHGVRGNRMRHHGPVWIRPDEEWKESLPPYTRILTSTLLWPLAHKYGYGIL